MDNYYKAEYMQIPISLLTDENLRNLELHCEKQIRREIGQRVREHEIILELIHKYKQQQEEIENQKEKENQFVTKLINEINEFIELQYELRKKDEIIDLMATQLVGLSIFDNDNDIVLILKTEEEVKKYFEGKIKEQEEKNR